MGITLATLRDWVGDPDLQRYDIEMLTEQAAAGIYCASFWNRLRCDALPAGVDLMVVRLQRQHRLPDRGASAAAGGRAER